MATVFEGDIIPLRRTRQVMPLILHGDAAFAGQGVVAEILGLSGLAGIVSAARCNFINKPDRLHHERRPSRFLALSSDVAKMIEAPIFHVNGDDPEAVVYAARSRPNSG